MRRAHSCYIVFNQARSAVPHQTVLTTHSLRTSACHLRSQHCQPGFGVQLNSRIPCQVCSTLGISQYSQPSGTDLLPHVKSFISHVTSFTPASAHCMSSEDRGTAPKNHLLPTHPSPTTRSSGLSRRALGATMKGPVTHALYSYKLQVAVNIDCRMSMWRQLRTALIHHCPNEPCCGTGSWFERAAPMKRTSILVIMDRLSGSPPPVKYPVGDPAFLSRTSIPLF